MSSLTFNSLVRRTMITLDETIMRAILGISTTGPQIFVKDFETLNWNNSEAFSLPFGVRVDKITGFKSSFPIKYLTPGAHALAKIAQSNFLPQGGYFHTIKMDCLLFLYVMLTLIEFNLPSFFWIL